MFLVRKKQVDGEREWFIEEIKRMSARPQPYIEKKNSSKKNLK